ncbi:MULTISPECIES: hypothetical protein [Vreelandella]|uniref:Uncharacterized protein n=2 Tax=Vreelandella TaxID=3137766 RepID=A0A7C9NQW7_9GAMM|nr:MULTISPECIES: hypothetical protein [Halomonas]NDL70687.1 hypothetical protein [Halomonas alkaliphila]NYS44784.1 hypothetical protein [Halomonas zhaodongensis]
MTIFFIWVITFALIAYFANKRWDSGVSQGLDKMLPEVLKTHGENRYIWVLALAILGATTMVRPVDILLVVILLAIIGLVIAKLASWASSKTTH